MNDRQQAVNMGAHDEPMPELVSDLIETFTIDVKFHRGTDSPMCGLFVARTVREVADLATKLQEAGIRVTAITAAAARTSSGRIKVADLLRLLSAGDIDCILMPVALASAGGFRLPVNRVTIASLSPLSPSEAVQLLGRADSEAKIRSLVWLKQEPKPQALEVPKLYSNLMVTFNDKLTEIQQDSIVGVLMALGCVEKVELGTHAHGAFDSQETITKDAANQVQRALSGQPDN